MDCSGVGIQYNIGKELRDLTGFDFIEDANIDYGMNVCASVDIGGTSCGVCVPCEVDTDCAPIDIDSIRRKTGGSAAQVRAALKKLESAGQLRITGEGRGARYSAV